MSAFQEGTVVSMQLCQLKSLLVHIVGVFCGQEVLQVAVVPRAIGVLGGKGCRGPAVHFFCVWEEVLV